MISIDKLKEKLVSASKIKVLAERGVTLATLIAEALRSVGQDPVLVGGTAVEFYTEGEYSTADIDMLSEGGADLMRVMSELGFKKLGKDYVNEKLKIYVEFPGRALSPKEKYNEINIDQMRLKIVSVEDLIIDRLAAFQFWQSLVDGLNVLFLLEIEEIDENRLQQRALEEQVIDTLEALQNLREQVIRKKLSKEKASKLLQETMRKLN